MGNKTLFKGISLLRVPRRGCSPEVIQPKSTRTFDFVDWEKQPTVESEGVSSPVSGKTVFRVFPTYMEDTRQVAVSLTAGLDTPGNTRRRHRDKNIHLPCYTFGGLWGETFDIRRARELASVCHQSHEVYQNK